LWLKITGAAALYPVMAGDVGAPPINANHAATPAQHLRSHTYVDSASARFTPPVSKANTFSASQGQLRFMLTKGRVTAAVFIEFLKRLLVNATTPIFVVVDGHPTHRAKSVARFVAAQEGRLVVRRETDKE
jgi:hypothetical protein